MGWFHPDLGAVALCRRCLMGPTQLFPLVTRAVFQECPLCVACIISAVVHLAASTVLVGGLSLGPVGYRALPCVVTVGPMEGRIGFPHSWLFNPRRCTAIIGPLLHETKFLWCCLHGWGSFVGLIFICWWMELFPLHIRGFVVDISMLVGRAEFPPYCLHGLGPGLVELACWRTRKP